MRFGIVAAKCDLPDATFGMVVEHPQSTRVEGADIVTRSSGFKRFDQPDLWVVLFRRRDSAPSDACHFVILKKNCRSSANYWDCVPNAT